MKVILDGVFNHCGSFNKWMDRERIYENQPEYPKGAFVSEDSPYHIFSISFDDRPERGLIIRTMIRGGEMIRFPSCHMRILRSWNSILWI